MLCRLENDNCHEAEGKYLPLTFMKFQTGDVDSPVFFVLNFILRRGKLLYEQRRSDEGSDLRCS